MSNATDKHDSYHIVTQDTDWKQHNSEKKRQALNHSAEIAKGRDLNLSAECFRPPKQLVNAINAAIAARVPLLLTGEPGTGKTQVAWFLKHFFDIPLYSYQVHSNSQASDLRYDFDAVAYLRDAYLAQYSGKTDNKAGNDVSNDISKEQDPRSNPRYLKKGPLWQAYTEEGECVLLIDEIDKAPRDFPNDLLQELDQYKFAHPFHSGEEIKRTNAPPLIIITSNGERRLPDAFLRRCMVHHIKLDKALLEKIMQAWEKQFPHLTAEAKAKALNHFNSIRDIRNLSKRPGTAELLLWLSVLSAQGIKENDLDIENLSELPALSCLIKDHEDYQYLES